MIIIAESFAQFLPYVFFMCCVGIIWDIVISAFRGHL